MGACPHAGSGEKPRRISPYIAFHLRRGGHLDASTVERVTSPRRGTARTRDAADHRELSVRHAEPLNAGTGVGLEAVEMFTATAPTNEKVIAGPILAVGGSLFEAALSSTGAFHYQHPDVLLVPAWLPALYLHASLLVREACLAFIARPRAEEPGR